MTLQSKISPKKKKNNAILSLLLLASPPPTFFFHPQGIFPCTERDFTRGNGRP